MALGSRSIGSSSLASGGAPSAGGPPPEVLLFGVGDSIAAGNLASDSAHQFLNLIATTQGWTLSANRAISATQIVDQVSDDVDLGFGHISQVYTGTDLTGGEITNWLTGYNDLRYWGTDAAALTAYERTLRAAVTWLSRKTSAIKQANNVAWDYTAGSWTGFDINGIHTSYSTTNGDIASVSVVGTAITVAWISHFDLPAGASDGGIFTIKIDGVTVDTIDTSGTVALSGYSFSGNHTRYAPMATRYSGLSGGSHTVEITVTTTGKTVQIAFVTGNGADTGDPIVMLGGNLRLDSTGYSSYSPYNNGSDAAAAAYYAKVTTIASEHTADGKIVHTYDATTNYVVATDLSTSDHVHPNDSGHQHIADGFIASLSGAPPDILYGGAPTLFRSRPYLFFDDDTNRFEFWPATVSYNLAAQTGVFNLTGNSVDLRATRILPAAVGSFVETGNPANLLYNHKLSLATGVFNEVGMDANLRATRKLSAGVGSFAFSGIAANLLRGLRLQAAKGDFTLTGQPAQLLVSHKLYFGTGVFNEVGNPAGLRATRLLTMQAGSFVFSGKAATLLKNSILHLDTGVFSMIGNAASLVVSADKVLQAGRGIFLLTGGDVTFRRTYVVPFQPGNFVLSGPTTNLLYNRKVFAQTGQFNFVGNDALLKFLRKLIAEPGVFVFDPHDANLLANRLLHAGRGTFIFTGLPAILISTGLDVGPAYSAILTVVEKPTSIVTVESKPTAKLSVEPKSTTVVLKRWP